MTPTTTGCAECPSTVDVQTLDHVPLCAACRSEQRCPECGLGRVVDVGEPCRETGYTDYTCSRGCGYSS